MWFLLLLSSFSYARDPSGPGPGRPPGCQVARVNHCIEEHRVARASSLAQASRLEEEIRILSEESRGFEKTRSDLDHSAKILSENERIGALEAEHLTRLLSQQKTAMPALFPGAPSLEKIFFLPEAMQTWSEVLPSERLSRLMRSLDEWNQERVGAKAREAEILQRIHSLASRISALDASKIKHLEEARAHGKMCESGCRERHCLEENP